MAAQAQQSPYDAQVAFVDGDVQRGLAALVARVEVGAGVGQQLHHGGLVAERGVVHGTVTVLVLNKTNHSSPLFRKKRCVRVTSET